MSASRTRYHHNTGPLLVLSVLTVELSALPQISLPGQDIRDIFLSDQSPLSVRSGAGGGYTGDSSASLDPNADILVEIVKGATSLTSDYNTNQVSQAQVESDRTFPDCSDYSQQLGYQCVPYYQCSNGTIITDGAGLIDIRNGFAALNPEESKCPGFLEVCCRDPDFVPPPPPVKYVPGCGRRNLNGLGARIQGFKDGESQVGEWPHMCALLRQETGEQGGVKTFQCGASLISPGVVLTAAHCVQKFRDSPGQLVVRCGEWDTQTTTEPFPHQDRAVASMAVHPEFNGRNLANDFAVLFMAADFSLDYNVDTVCLPEPGQKFDGRSCFATGWGKDKFGTAGEFQVVLKELEIPVVERGVCQEKFRASRLGSRFRLDPSFMCAGGGRSGQDTCEGDGGGPLVCPSSSSSSSSSPGTFTQAGIVAWGVGCGGETPGAYAAVSEAVCWVDLVTSCHYSQQFSSSCSSSSCSSSSSSSVPSHFSYSRAQCGSWLERTLARLSSLPARVRRVLEAEYNQCQVDYRDNTHSQQGELFDFSMFERVGSPDTGR